MTPLKLSLSILIATLTACSTIPEPMPPPDITEERLHLHLHESCKIIVQAGGKYLKCDGEPEFVINDDCVIEIENKERVLTCGE